MEITVKSTKRRGDRGTRLVAMQGEMTIYAASAAKDTLLDALAGAADVEIDLSGVTEMDTAGVQLLVLLKREAASADKRLRLSHPSPAVMDVIDGYRLAAHFGDVMLTSEGKR
jgi:anti-anti-sigma factor